jgi:hypothetical protein
VSKNQRLSLRVLLALPSPFTLVRSSHLPAVGAGKHTGPNGRKSTKYCASVPCATVPVRIVITVPKRLCCLMSVTHSLTRFEAGVHTMAPHSGCCRKCCHFCVRMSVALTYPDEALFKRSHLLLDDVSKTLHVEARACACCRGRHETGCSACRGHGISWC